MKELKGLIAVFTSPRGLVVSAAGAALALQRLVDSGQSLRNAQYLAARISSFGPAAIEVGEEFDTALDDARAAIGGNHA